MQDRAAAVAERACFDRAAAALERGGAWVLGYNGAQAGPRTIAAVHQLAPDARDTFCRTTDAAETGVIMQDFGLEQLRVRDERLPARVLLLADVPRGKRRQALRLRGTAGDYTFLVARSAGALRAQHAVPDDLRPLPAG